jgi:hypothetical protein
MDFGATDVATPVVLQDFIDLGRHLFEAPVDPTAASDLLAAIHADRRFDGDLFLTEAEFDANPVYTGVNPRPGRNLLDTFADRLAFIERDAAIVSALTTLLGSDYEVLGRKIVCGIPDSIIPDWVKGRIAGGMVNNLGCFMRPEYRDITYFYGIDFHQDLIDYKDRNADFVTLYCYLHPVTAADAPLYLLDGSHRLGATVFPHDLRRDGGETWLYGDRQGGETQVGQRVLTGETGFTAIWHACTLHGTQPDVADHERISLRYLLARRPGSPAGIDAVNRTLAGPIRLAGTRLDIAADGSPTMKGNTVNQV